MSLNQKSNENYQKRFEACMHNAAKHNADSIYWRIAAEVYEHLIKCPLSHHGPGLTCQWQSGESNNSLTS